MHHVAKKGAKSREYKVILKYPVAGETLSPI